MKFNTIFLKIREKLFPSSDSAESSRYHLLFSTYSHYDNVTDEDVEKLMKYIESLENAQDE